MDYRFRLRLERVFRDFKKRYSIHKMEASETEEDYLVQGGTEDYVVKLFFDEDGRLTDWSCTCPDFSNRGKGICKHIIGVLYEIGMDYVLIPQLLEQMEDR